MERQAWMYVTAIVGIVTAAAFGAYCVSLGHDGVVIASVMMVIGGIVGGLGGFAVGKKGG